MSGGEQLGPWVPVEERMPAPGEVVLAAYRNRLGHWRRIRAEWVPAKTQEADIDNEHAEYDAETDTYYTPQGWYERINNWDEYSSVKVHEGEPSHWMHLPFPPDAGRFMADAEPQESVAKAVAKRDEEWRAHVCSLLAGIDKDECADPAGWWETSTGAENGATVLRRVLEGPNCQASAAPLGVGCTRS